MQTIYVHCVPEYVMNAHLAVQCSKMTTALNAPMSAKNAQLSAGLCKLDLFKNYVCFNT